MRVGAYPHAIFVSGNLRPDSATGVGSWSAAQIAQTIRSGRTPTRTLDVFGMPWAAFHNLSDSDALAIGSYLRTLTPIYRGHPAPLRYGVVETVIGKIRRGLPAGQPAFLTYADGDFSRETPGPSRDLLQRILILAQWFVLILGAVAMLIVRPRPRPARAIASTLGVVVGGFLVWFIYETPAVAFIPPEQIAAGFNGSIPKPQPATPMTSRGYYLYSVAGCQFCHGPKGAGGLKVSWAPFGTRWARNISPDSTNGIGAWSDAQVARAIRSGVERGGGPLHWQAMIWDHASNWDEEDIRALIAFLRTLPPSRQAIPAPRDPGPDDCAIYSFWITPDTMPGCR
jgi:mono/diheme cytochrome c family protein